MQNLPGVFCHRGHRTLRLASLLRMRKKEQYEKILVLTPASIEAKLSARSPDRAAHYPTASTLSNTI